LCRRPSISGAVFPSFNFDVHVTEEPWGRGPYEMRLAVDFGFANPFVCLWIKEVPQNGMVHVVDEYGQSGRVMQEHVNEIQSRRQWAQPRDQILSCDPAGGGPNDQTAESNIAYLKRVGYRVRTRRSKIEDGLEMIRFALRPAAGEPTL